MTSRISLNTFGARGGRKGAGSFTALYMQGVFSHAVFGARQSSVNGRDDAGSLQPFGGCSRLLDQYRLIGAALVHFEQELHRDVLLGDALRRDFSHAVAFVPVEVLESYLEDLLDLNVSDESLFFCKRASSFRMPLLLIALGGASFWLAQAPNTLPLPVMLGITFLLGVVATGAFLPHTRPVRRFGAAKVVANEISRRRGRHRGDGSTITTPSLLRGLWQGSDLWRGKGGRTPTHLPPQPARVPLRDAFAALKTLKRLTRHVH